MIMALTIKKIMKNSSNKCLKDVVKFRQIVKKVAQTKKISKIRKANDAKIVSLRIKKEYVKKPFKYYQLDD